MNESKWNNESGDSRIEKAERAVSGSLDRLETAMETITEKVEDSSQKIRHVLDMGVRQKDELYRLKDQAASTLMPVLERGRTFGTDIYSRMRSDPRPYLYGALLIVGGLILLSFRSRRYATGSLNRHPSLSVDEPDTWAA